jgi:1-deoxy-D-xylulose-5-phosphate reductoisomerase
MTEEIKKRIAILGSTGSIGTQALEVIEEQKNSMEVELLSANSNADLLISQALKFNPNTVIISDESKYEYVKKSLEHTLIKVFCGISAIEQEVQNDNIDIVLTAMVGYAGLMPTISAIKAKKNIALANKETLVVAGDIITKMAKENVVNIYPVDSEHSAIFQCLAGEWNNPIEKIIITASGGPFRGKKINELVDVKKEQALKHPNWTMGRKITIDSSTLMNKGLEVIEAKWLFNLKPQQIEVIVHPQSIIHSMVQFQDGSIKAQLGLPDMKLPIQYALAYPNRVVNSFKRFSFIDYPNFTFEKPDLKSFQCLSLAYEALKQGGNMACILNAANEIAVEKFLNDEITFLEIPQLIEFSMRNTEFINNPSIEDYIYSNTKARKSALDWNRKIIV